jgi:hypothetical protein
MKSKIPVKPKSSVRWLLENATGSQLDFLRSLSNQSNFKDFENLISKFKDYNVYSVFEYKATSEADLFEYRSYRKGAVDTLSDLVLAVRLAKEEAARRKKQKE